MVEEIKIGSYRGRLARKKEGLEEATKKQEEERAAMVRGLYAKVSIQ